MPVGEPSRVEIGEPLTADRARLSRSRRQDPQLIERICFLDSNGRPPRSERQRPSVPKTNRTRSAGFADVHPAVRALSETAFIEEHESTVRREIPGFRKIEP